MRYGIIGCGSMGREHIENIRALGGGAKVTAIADPHAPSREAALALGEGIVAFERTDQLLNSGLVDVLVIASPNFTHIGVMREALATPGGEIPVLGVPSGTYEAGRPDRTARYRIIEIENGRITGQHLRVWHRDRRVFARDEDAPAASA